jgi:hypothetical protein
MTAAILTDETTLPSCGSAAFSRFPQSGKTQAIGVGNLWKNPVKHVYIFEKSSVLGGPRSGFASLVKTCSQVAVKKGRKWANVLVFYWLEHVF